MTSKIEFYNRHLAAGTDVEARSAAIKAEIENNPNLDMVEVRAELDALAELKEERASMKVLGSTAQNTVSFDADTVAAAPEYRAAFMRFMKGAEMSSVEKQAFRVANEKRAANTSANSAAVIPEHMQNEILTAAKKQGGLMAEARAFAIPAGVSIPVAQAQTQGGYWHQEGEVVDPASIVTTNVKFAANEIMKVFGLSQKVLKMSIPALSQYINDELADAVYSTIGQSLVSGTGADGQGKGLAAIEWTADTNLVTAAAPGWAELTKALALLPRKYARNAKIAMNHRTLWNIWMNATDNNKRPLFVQNPANEGAAGKLAGFEVVIDDFIEDGETYIGDFKQLCYNLPEGIAIEQSKEEGFSRGLTMFRSIALADTQVLLSEAFVKIEQVA